MMLHRERTQNLLAGSRSGFLAAQVVTLFLDSGYVRRPSAHLARTATSFRGTRPARI